VEDMNRIVATHNLLFLSFDTLRYDVARDAYAAGKTPNLAALMGSTWEARHTPASFTYAAHQAFFAGFLPTPVQPGPHARLFATAFAGSETTTTTTCVLPTDNIVTGLASMGFHTICIGGVGFFSKRDPLGSVLPAMFAESHWDESLGVTTPDSTRNQFQLAARLLDRLPVDRRFFLFINLAALHQPNCFYLDAAQDTLASHEAALVYIDSQLPLLTEAIRRRGDCFAIFCSDHGTAYGEDGYHGHRLAHEVVWTVPYRDFTIEGI